MTLVALAVAIVFGGADQYLGSLSAHPWAADVSLLSAPWLAVPFLAGLTQPTARRAALLGLAATAAALAGYALMTLSPVENAHLTLHGVIGFVRSDPPVFIGAAATGPLFGWLGHARRRLGWLVLGALTCLEPAAHTIRFQSVAVAEIAAGLVVAALAARRV